MKNSPYLDKPLRSEREVKMEALLRQMVDDWPGAFENYDVEMSSGNCEDALVDYLYQAKELLK